MKKVKKNNKPIIILIVGLLISGCLIGFSIYKMNEHKKFLIEDRKTFDKRIDDETKECEAAIERAKKEIETLENEIEEINTEITLLQREQTKVFREDRGFSDRYYSYSDKITEKRKEQTKKRDKISSKNSEISELDTTLWKIENEWDGYRYKYPGYKNGNPYLPLGLGIFGCIITIGAAGISRLIKAVSSEKSYSEYNEIDEGALSRVNVNDGVLLKKELYNKLENLLFASSKEDYDTIRKLCTKNMARGYIDEVELLKKHKQNLVIKEVSNGGCKIVNAYNTQHNTKVTVVVKVKLYNYTKDVTTNEIISGDDKKKTEQAYKLVFVKDFAQGHNVNKCYNCGANIKDATKVSCDYCGTVFDNSNYDWYLESKVIISED